MSESRPKPDALGRRLRKSPKPSLSLVIPVYKNEENIAELTDALIVLCDRLGSGLEIIFVIDGSPDNSGSLLIEARKRIPCRSKIVFHSRNFGAFGAIRTGLEIGDGDYFAAMAADLQDPPELIIAFFDRLTKNESDIVFGQRTGRDDPLLRRLASDFFWWVYRRLVLPDIPKGGVDLFGCSRRVRDEVLQISEPNSSLIAQLFWVGFRRSFVPYARRRRAYGKSAWNTSRRMRYMMDSVFSFSDAPIQFVLFLGLFGCFVSITLGVITFVARLFGFIEQPGYATLVLVILFFGSAILVVQGIVGSYLWRTFENTKKRPLRIISHVVSD
jgi:glycosyltransferase involved in cell wall biosynthesis